MSLDAGQEKPQRAQVYLGPRNSIAILPFTGESQVTGQAFWAPGFSRELHRSLTRTPGLQVTSLNSSFFPGLQPAQPELIAERLQVRHLLSGEFHESNGTIRITAGLFDAKQKVETWSGHYEGSLEEAFSFMDQILVALVDAIKPVKRGDLPQAVPVNSEAWKHYLQGLYFAEQRTLNGFREAEQSFLFAKEVAPGFGLARVALARLWMGQIAGGSAPLNLVEATRGELESALDSEPAVPDALGLLSYLNRSVDWNWAGALEAANQAVELIPGDSDLMSTASLAMFSLGQFRQAGELLEQSVAQDPLNLAKRLRLGLLLEFAGEPEEAVKRYRQIIALNPEFPGVRAYLARVRIIQDKASLALEESEQEVDPFWKRYSMALALTALGRNEDPQSLLEQMIAEDGDQSAYQITEILALNGETNRAFEWFQRAYEQHDGGMTEVVGNYFLENLHGDPRWAEMLDRLGLPHVGAD